MKKKTLTERLSSEIDQRLILFLILICGGFCLIFVANNVITHLDPVTGAYQNKMIFPEFPPAGNDFRVGYYWPASYLVETGFKSIGPDGTYPSNYPPLVALTSLPYLLFDSNIAYLVHVGLLILANLACFWLVIRLAGEFILSRTGLSEITQKMISILLFILIAIYIFSSYFFAYSIERGNTDIFAILYCLLALWVLVKQPQKIWLQVILLSVAVHFKIYPLVLFPLLLFKHGKKLILPTLVVNLVFLFCLGPQVTWDFIQSVTSGGLGAGIGNYWPSAGNHAAYSFAIGIDKSDAEFLTGTFFLIWGIAMLIPLLLWGFSTIALALKKYSAYNGLLLFMVSVPLMSLLPTVSIDYKLVILSAPICLLMVLILKQFLRRFSWFDLAQMVVLSAALLMIHRSYAFIGPERAFICNKYIWILLLELLMVINIIRDVGKPSKIVEKELPDSAV